MFFLLILPVTAQAQDINDTFLNQEKFLKSINASSEWLRVNLATSTNDQVVVAIIDTGIDTTRPDLKDALWTNPDEVLDGIDNDHNGYIDDIHGWNFVLNNSTTAPIVLKNEDDNWIHGTAVASLIAGRGNNDIGVAGLSWKVKIMSLNVFNGDNLADMDNLAKAIDYATRQGADIINLSLQAELTTPDVKEAIDRATAQGVLIVSAAGNYGLNLNKHPIYPACYKGVVQKSILTVGSLDADSNLSWSSNYGDYVNITAPGEDIFVVQPIYDRFHNQRNVSGYTRLTGTSFSAPMVAGTAALLKAIHPLWSGQQLARVILDSATVSDKNLFTKNNKILNVDRALKMSNKFYYGPWYLFANQIGERPEVIIKNSEGKKIFDFFVGSQEDRRGVQVGFLRSKTTLQPNILVTYIGDKTGEWRIYRYDGVLLKVNHLPIDKKIKGGLLIATQDMNNDGSDDILFAEREGDRMWVSVDLKNFQETKLEVGNDPVGVVAVGIKHPIQGFVLIAKDKKASRMAVLTNYLFDYGMSIQTDNPRNLKLDKGLSFNKKELIRITQSGDSVYFRDKNLGMRLDRTIKKAMVILESSLGLKSGVDKFLFYDTWPR